MAYDGSIVTLTPICTARGQEHRASFRIFRALCFDKITSPWYSEGCTARGGVMASCRHRRRNYVTRRSQWRKVRGEWKFHDEKFRNLQYSLIIIKAIRSGKIRWAGHVAHMGEKLRRVFFVDKVNAEVSLITGRGRSWDCETSRLPHFVGILLTGGGDVSLSYWPSFTSWRFLVLIPARGWVYRRAIVRPEGLSKFREISQSPQSSVWIAL
jgi:hypothetical protein